jgi:hypothetical protein
MTQEEHHKKKQFREEYLAILEENNIDFNQEYLFNFFNDIFEWE